MLHLGLASFRRTAHKCSPNFPRDLFVLVSPGFQAPLKNISHPEFTLRTVGEFQIFCSHMFFTPIFCLCPCHAKPSLTKSPFPISRFFHFFSHWPSACSAFSDFQLHFAVFLYVCSMPGLICMFRIFYGLNMRKLRVTGFVRDGFGCNPLWGRSLEKGCDAGAVWQNAACRVAICDLELRFRGSRRVGTAIWKLRSSNTPEGPNLEKFQDRPPGLKFSSEIETNDIFKRDWKFQASHPPNP